MQKKDFSLKNINSEICERIKTHDLDFCKMLVHATEEDLSVTAKYDPPKSYYSLSEGEVSCQDGFYYGVSPCLDKQEIVRCVSNLELLSEKKTKEYISSHAEWFMAHSNQKDYLAALARYIVVCMASHFGIRIKMSPQKHIELIDYLTKECKYSINNLKVLLSFSEEEKRPLRPKDSVLTIKGCPTEEIIRFLDKYRYRFLCGDNAIPLVDMKTGKQYETLEAWELIDADDAIKGSKNIKEVYSEHVDLIEGRVFYSGVLLKPTELEIISGTKENNKIRSLCIHFERSTYGTVCALDRNLTDHPVLQDVKSTIVSILQKDDQTKRKLNKDISIIEGEELEDSDVSVRLISAVNEYLKNCVNVNQIGVSANIITGDGLLLLGQRSQANIDAGKLYPSVNGNAEVADSQVSFYSLSVYEDYPTIHLDSDRIDFFGEIGREAYGELKLYLPKQEWICYGIVICGNMPRAETVPSGYYEPFRRMHFNLIFEHHTEKTFLEIEKLSKQATEAFETKRYLGVSIKCEENKLSRIGKSIINGIIGIVSQKEFIEAAVALVLFLMAITRTISGESIQISTLFQRLKELSLTNVLTLFLALLVVIITVPRFLRAIIQFIQRRKNNRFITVFHKDSYEDVNKRMDSILRIHKYKRKKELYDFHPATYACLRSFVDNLLNDTFSPKDRR